jgi:adenylate cyclase class IV
VARLLVCEEDVRAFGQVAMAFSVTDEDEQVRKQVHPATTISGGRRRIQLGKQGLHQTENNGHVRACDCEEQLMSRNLEIKARVRGLPRLRHAVEEIAGGPIEILAQKDIYFRTNTGRLKVRDAGPSGGQLIYYERSDEAGPRTSGYLTAPAAAVDVLTQVLDEALGIVGTVSKKRVVYLVGRTRIHLDEVDGLGSFIELEYVFEDPFTMCLGSDVEAQRAAPVAVVELMDRLDIKRADLIGNSYIDLT